MANRDEPESPADLIDARIEELSDWRGETLSRIRHLVKAADPDVEEAVKWRTLSNPKGVPVWVHDGVVCTGELYAEKVKLTFPNGASLEDPGHLFNASLDGDTRRAIDLVAGDGIDEEAFKSLVRATAAYNATTRGG